MNKAPVAQGSPALRTLCSVLPRTQQSALQEVQLGAVAPPIKPLLEACCIVNWSLALGPVALALVKLLVINISQHHGEYGEQRWIGTKGIASGRHYYRRPL